MCNNNLKCNNDNEVQQQSTTKTRTSIKIKFQKLLNITYGNAVFTSSWKPG